MAVERVASAAEPGLGERLEATAGMLARRGYALPPRRLGEICLGGPVLESDVLAVVARGGRLVLAHGLVLAPGQLGGAAAIALRARGHACHAAAVLPETAAFVESLLRWSPYILAVAVSGSLAAGGFAAADDVDLNLVVEDGRRHLAYVAVNALGTLHALRHRHRPADVHTRRPLAPRFMTANLILERSQCCPLPRADADMAYELLASRPVHGAAIWASVVAANPGLTAHLPQLTAWSSRPVEANLAARAPRWLFPAGLDRPARALGRAAWRWMMWTRRHRPDALAHVAYVRATMRPYALFDDR